MLTVHHLEKSQSARIVWLCEELGLPYELVRYARDPVTKQAPPEYRALHPFGTAPVIVDDGLVLPESAAIVEYLCRRHAGGRLLLGPEHPDYAEFLHWYHFANGSLIPSITLEYVAPESQVEINGVLPRGLRALAVVEARLGTADYFAGAEFTAADIMMQLNRIAATRDLSSYPNIAAYAKRIDARPAYIRSATAG